MDVFWSINYFNPLMVASIFTVKSICRGQNGKIATSVQRKLINYPKLIK